MIIPQTSAPHGFGMKASGVLSPPLAMMRTWKHTVFIMGGLHCCLRRRVLGNACMNTWPRIEQAFRSLLEAHLEVLPDLRANSTDAAMPSCPKGYAENQHANTPWGCRRQRSETALSWHELALLITVARHTKVPALPSSSALLAIASSHPAELPEQRKKKEQAATVPTQSPEFGFLSEAWCWPRWRGGTDTIYIPELGPLSSCRLLWLGGTSGPRDAAHVARAGPGGLCPNPGGP